MPKQPLHERRRVAKPVKIERRKAYEAISYATRAWGPKSLQPLVVMAQLNAHYVPISGPIRHEPNPKYDEQLIEVIRFAQKRDADFCVFPEFSCPVSAAAKLKSAASKAAQSGCVSILPFEHMLVEQYKGLLKKFGVSATLQKQEALEIQQFVPVNPSKAVVNAALIVVPAKKGVEVVPQRKLRPAKLEQWGMEDSRFAKGRTIRIIHGDRCTFAVLICFDFIHRDDSARERPRDVLAENDLDLLFVPECNPQPLHDFYLTSAIDLYQAPAWAQQRPIVLLNNVAAGSTLGDYPARFGFTRLIGDLGNVTASAELREFDGFISGARVRELADLDPSKHENQKPTLTHVRDEQTQTVIFRPEQSVFVCQLPTLGAKSISDRQASAIDTHIEIYRPIGGADEWERVRELPTTPVGSSSSTTQERPSIDLTGAEELQQRFRYLIQRETLLVVTGEDGAGKTALVSSMLDHVICDDVIWLDLATLERSEDALLEAVLRKLGRVRDLVLSRDDQYASIRTALRAQSTVLVLDSAEAWKERLPEKLLELHGWKTLVVVAGRFENASIPPKRSVLEVTGLSLANFGALVAKSGGPILPTLALTMYNSSHGSARVAVWTGEFIVRNPAEAKELDDHLAKAYGNYLERRSAGSPAEALAVAGADESEREDEPPITLAGIYEWFKERLTRAALDVLELLCEMPAALRIEDLEAIVGRPDVSKLIEELNARNLLQAVRPDTYRQHVRHTSHPFVRQLWKAANRRPGAELARGLTSWADLVLSQYGRDRDPNVSPIVSRQWPNLSHVLRLLAVSKDKRDLHKFVELQRYAVDYLWAAGRWRERMSFGMLAAEIANAIGDAAAEAEALFDAQAKTLWHREGTKDTAEKLIDRAAAIAEKHRLKSLEARVEWYRSRMLLHVGELAPAVAAAKKAVALADAAKDLQVRITSRMGLGNAYRESNEPDAALRAYAEVADLLKNASSSQAYESRGVLDRNVARVHLRKEEYAPALKRLENAMDIFATLGLVVQEAETAVYYAEALARVGEAATAERHLEWGRERLDPLGSVLRQRSIANARAAIDEAKRKRQKSDDSAAAAPA